MSADSLAVKLEQFARGETVVHDVTAPATPQAVIGRVTQILGRPSHQGSTYTWERSGARLTLVFP